MDVKEKMFLSKDKETFRVGLSLIENDDELKKVIDILRDKSMLGSKDFVFTLLSIQKERIIKMKISKK